MRYESIKQKLKRLEIKPKEINNQTGLYKRLYILK